MVWQCDQHSSPGRKKKSKGRGPARPPRTSAPPGVLHQTSIPRTLAQVLQPEVRSTQTVSKARKPTGVLNRIF